MSTLKKATLLLIALASACISAPVEPTEEVSVTTQAIEVRATPQSFILSPIPLLEALDEAGKNSSNWFQNQTYMNVQGVITANITEAARFIFIGADDQKLELVVENNRSLTFGVDAALFNKVVLQFFQPIQNSQNQLESGENNLQLAEAECQETCNRTSGSMQCSKCKGESQTTQGFSFLTDDSDLSYYQRALSVNFREETDNSLKARDFPCAPEATMCYSDHHCLSEWLGIRCNMKCGGPYKIGNIYEPGEQYGHVTGCYYTEYGRTWIHCTCFETPVRSVNEEPIAISQPDTSSSIDDDFVPIATRSENAQPDLDFEPGTFLTWTNEKFVVVENDIVMSSPVAGFCVEGMGQPGFQVNVVSPVADEDIYKSCIEVGLSPTFI